MRRWFPRGLLLSILAVVMAAAQISQEPPVFRSTAALVAVDTLVLHRGQPLAGLGPEDFIVRDNGAPRPIEAFSHEAAPLQIVLVLDVSGSMGRMLRSAAATGRQALEQLSPQDEVAVFFFARRARLAQEFTREIRLAARALQEAAIESGLGAGTSLNDALLEVARYLGSQPPFSGRRALIVLTDNGGVHYRLPDEEVIRALSAVNAVVNAIVPEGVRPPRPASGPEVNPDFTPANIFRIAEATGGEVLRSADAGARLRDLIARTRLRYSLMIRPADAGPGEFRSLSVELAPGARSRFPGAALRHRSGYYAPAGEAQGSAESPHAGASPAWPFPPRPAVSASGGRGRGGGQRVSTTAGLAAGGLGRVRKKALFHDKAQAESEGYGPNFVIERDISATCPGQARLAAGEFPGESRPALAANLSGSRCRSTTHLPAIHILRMRKNGWTLRSTRGARPAAPWRGCEDFRRDRYRHQPSESMKSGGAGVSGDRGIRFRKIAAFCLIRLASASPGRSAGADA